LLRRQRDAGDGGAAHFRQIKAETAPARTGVEHAVAGPGQQLGGEMPFLGELGFVECQGRAVRNRRSCIACRHRGTGNRAVRRDRSGARHCSSNTARIELLRMPRQIAQPPLQLGPARQHLGLIEQDHQGIRHRALFDHESAVHIGLAQRQFRVHQEMALRLDGQAPHRDRLAGDPWTAGRGECHRPPPNELPQKCAQQTIHRNYLFQCGRVFEIRRVGGRRALFKRAPARSV